MDVAAVTDLCEGAKEFELSVKALVLDLVQSGELVRVSREIIRPFYEQRSRRALGWLLEAVSGLPCRVHKPEGAFFFWLWCEGLPVSAQELYERLKENLQG